VHNYNDEIKENKLGRGCSTNAKKMNVYRLLVRKSEVKRPLGRPRCSWVVIIKMDLGEIECSGMDWMGLDQSRD
jgi:hypothetical protein